MSQENVEIVRRLYANTRDMVGVRDLFAPDAEIDFSASIPIWELFAAPTSCSASSGSRLAGGEAEFRSYSGRRTRSPCEMG
jgi:hypothetical protein